MPKTDPYEAEILDAYDKGQLKSVATKEELSRLKDSARSASLQDQRVNILLSSGDLQELQVKALEEGVPYQALISSIVHKYVSGRLVERKAENVLKASAPRADRKA